MNIYLQGSFEKLIEIYCERTESFGGVVQDILTKVALKVSNSFKPRSQYLGTDMMYYMCVYKF